MNYTKRVIAGMIIVLALASPAVYGEGDMGSGGKTCPQGQPTCFVGDAETTKTDVATTSLDGDMGSGGLNAVESYVDWLIGSIYARLAW